jgi:hypothetical protein
MRLRIRFPPQILVLTAIAMLAVAAFWPILGVLPGRPAQVLTVIAALTAFCGGFLVPRGSQLAFAFLWAAFGVAAALSVLGVFSGLIVVYAATALVLVAAISALPNESGFPSRWDWHFILVFAVAYGAIIGSAWIAARDSQNLQGTEPSLGAEGRMEAIRPSSEP